MWLSNSSIVFPWVKVRTKSQKLSSGNFLAFLDLGEEEVEAEVVEGELLGEGDDEEVNFSAELIRPYRVGFRPWRNRASKA